MTIVHMVLFKLKPDAPHGTTDNLLRALRTLAALPHVDSRRLVVGGPSLSEPAESSQGYDCALLSFHADRAALRAYQGSAEHKAVVDEYLLPFKSDIIRFDFEVPEGDVASFRGGVEGNEVTI